MSSWLSRPALAVKRQHTNRFRNKHLLESIRWFSVTESRNMKLLQFVYKDKPAEIRAGVLADECKFIDINKVDPSLPCSTLDIVRFGHLEKVRQLSTEPGVTTQPLDSVILKAPVTGVDKVLCIGLNYIDHCHEQKLTPPPVPMIFSKFASSLIGAGDVLKLRTDVTQTRKHTPIQVKKVILRAPITGVDKVLCIGLNFSDFCKEQKLKKPPIPMVFSKFSSCLIGSGDFIKLRTEVTKRVDWEVELAIVMGKVCSNVKAANAYDYVLGYTVAQDISARDWQKDKNMGQFLLGKSMDTFCPIGPWIVTKDEIKDPQSLKIKCSINGVVKQKSDTGKFIHKIPDVIERISSVMTLLPGDLVLTGTPGGVGVHRKPPEFLKPGDVITSEIQCIGRFDVKVDKFN